MKPTKKQMQDIIREVLTRRTGTNGGGQDIESLSASVANSIDYGPEFRDMRPETLRAAMEMAPDRSGYVELMQYARHMMALQKRIGVKDIPEENETARTVDREMTNWGFLIKCRDAWQAKGHLGNVSDLTVGYTAAMIAESGRWLSEKEMEWCEKVSEKDYENCIDDEKRESARLNSKNEAIVTITMMKIDLKAEKEPEKVTSFFDEKRKKYEEYFMNLNGSEPDWSINPYMKPVRCSSLDEIKNKKQHGL